MKIHTGVPESSEDSEGYSSENVAKAINKLVDETKPLIFNSKKTSVLQSLKRWRLSLAAAKNGDRNSNLLILGDSTSVGSGATGEAGYVAGSNGRTKGPIYQLAEMFRGIGFDSYTDSCVGGQNAQNYYGWDTRFVAGAGWSTGGTSTATLATTFTRPHFNSTTTNPLAFTPALSINRLIIHYAIKTSVGSFTWSLDGGSANSVNIQGAETSVGKVEVTAGSVGQHTLSISRVSGSIHILAIEAFDSTKTGINIIHMGGSGTSMASVQAATNPWDALNFIKHLQPDLTIINLVVNNWILNTSIATYKAQIDVLMQYLLSNNIEAIFITGVPTQVTWVSGSGTISTEKQLTYVNALIEKCNEYGFIYLDTYSRFGSQEQALLDGLYTDYTHPNRYGYYDMMKYIFDYISRI